MRIANHNASFSHLNHSSAPAKPQTPQFGMHYYAAKELWRRTPPKRKRNIKWTTGILAAHLLLGTMPFYNQSSVTLDIGKDEGSYGYSNGNLHIHKYKIPITPRKWFDMDGKGKVAKGKKSKAKGSHELGSFPVDNLPFNEQIFRDSLKTTMPALKDTKLINKYVKTARLIKKNPELRTDFEVNGVTQEKIDAAFNQKLLKAGTNKTRVNTALKVLKKTKQ